MKFTGKIDVPAPRQAVFEKLRDANFFASCVDGVQDLVEIDDRHYTATLETRVAYIKFKFAVSVEIVELDEPVRVVARVEGTPVGTRGGIVVRHIFPADAEYIFRITPYFTTNTLVSGPFRKASRWRCRSTASVSPCWISIPQ